MKEQTDHALGPYKKELLAADENQYFIVLKGKNRVESTQATELMKKLLGSIVKFGHTNAQHQTATVAFAYHSVDGEERMMITLHGTKSVDVWEDADVWIHVPPPATPQPPTSKSPTIEQPDDQQDQNVTTAPITRIHARRAAQKLEMDLLMAPLPETDRPEDVDKRMQRQAMLSAPPPKLADWSTRSLPAPPVTEEEMLLFSQLKNRQVACRTIDARRKWRAATPTTITSKCQLCRNVIARQPVTPHLTEHCFIPSYARQYYLLKIDPDRCLVCSGRRTHPIHIAKGCRWGSRTLACKFCQSPTHANWSGICDAQIALRNGVEVTEWTEEEERRVMGALSSNNKRYYTNLGRVTTNTPPSPRPLTTTTESFYRQPCPQKSPSTPESS